ncbi:hypothetical protein [Breznakia pachnodae]|uniref:Uncharacterized protein n=1 Tax=Breznakia pachnodae TaxID=265178 RepID=A0ABU0E421_9FIRM|nr:hypothetical protein [Breznakia pachnodae]MDQ0361630.1 hypothetical protein [Breznakia pachnodae]
MRIYDITPYLGITFQTPRGDGFITASAVVNGNPLVQIKTNKEIIWIPFEKEPFDMNLCKGHTRKLRINKFDVDKL